MGITRESGHAPVTGSARPRLRVWPDASRSRLEPVTGLLDQAPPVGGDVNLRSARGLTVSVIIPTLNEAGSLPHVLRLIPKDVTEIIVVDGLSTDGTPDVVRKHSPQARIILQTAPGKGAALRAGVAAAVGDIVVMLDADGSTNPQEIPRFVAALVDGADLAKGSRFLPGAGTDDMPLIRRLGNGALVGLTNLLFRTRYTDITYGYNAVWRSQTDALALEIDGWAQEIVGSIRAARHGLSVVEVPSFEESRVAGEAKLETFSAGWTILKAILSERVRRKRQRVIAAVPLELRAITVHRHGLRDPEMDGLADVGTMRQQTNGSRSRVTVTGPARSDEETLSAAEERIQTSRYKQP